MSLIAISQTSDTANTYGLLDYGLLQDGKVAGINIIEFVRLGLFRLEAIFDFLTGGRRLIQRGKGYEGPLETLTP